jgi:WD40 repeat protein
VHAGRVQAVAFSPDGRTLAAGVNLSGVRIWHLDDLERESALVDRSGTDVAFHPTEPLLATVSGWITLRRLDDLEALVTVPADPGINQAIEFSADGTLLAGTGVSTMGVWRLKDGTAAELLSSRTGTAGSSSVAISPDGLWLATSSDKGLVNVWMTSALDQDPHVLGKTGTTTWDVAISHDSKAIAAATDAGLYVWDSLEAEPRVLTGDETWSVEFSPDGQLMASGDRAGAVTLWRLSDMTLMSKLMLDDRVDCLAFSPDGRTLAAGSFMGTVRLWRLP